MEFDFSIARRRIEEALARLDGADESHGDDTLRARAAQLARRRVRGTSTRAASEETLIVMRRGASLVGVAARRVERIQWSPVCALSFGPPAVVGVVMEASEPVALVDIVRPVRRVSHGSKTLAAFCTTAAGPLAILVDEILGPRPANNLASVTHLPLGPIVQARGEDGVLVIDLDALAEWADVRVQ